MHENKSVMNNLMHISAAIAEASKKNRETDKAAAVSGIPDPVSAAEEVHENHSTQTSAPAGDKEILHKALQRRYDELQRMRADLTARLTEETAKLQSGLRKKEELLRALEDMHATLRNAEQEFSFLDQSKLAAECRTAETVRLGLIRLAPLLAAEETPQKNAPGTASTFMNELRSLTFSQIAAAGTAFLLPLILTILGAALIIAAAIILSFNGMFVW